MKILLFSGDKCGACRIAKSYADACGIKYTLVSRDDKEGARMTAQYHISSIPALIVFGSNDKPAKQFIGATCFQQFQKWSAGL